MEPIAVIGIANLFPGSTNPQEFWQNLVAKKDMRSKLASEEAGVDITEYMGKQGEVDKVYCEYGGYIRDFKFDGKDIALPQEHLASLDNLYKWCLYVAREALADAGVLNKKDLLKRCGVILANLSFPTRSSNYLFMPLYKRAIESALTELAFPNKLPLPNFSNLELGVGDDNMLIAGYPAALIARALQLGGVSFALDAACASSCYSVKLACDYLNTAKADLMLAGAVSGADPLFVNMGFSIFHAYPDNDYSAPLDVNSKGLFAGEGAGFFVLKRYADAVRDGDRIYSLVIGGGLSNDGKGEFVLSPNSKGQILAYQRAYQDASVNPATIQMVECHATGTPKGDRVELSSMGAFFSRYQSKPLLGSVKSNLSHLLSAAGMPGMMKVMQGMNAGLIPATINLREAVQARDGYFRLENIPVDTVPWPAVAAGEPRRAGVSTFGFGGSNAHLVFEQPGWAARKAQAAPPAAQTLPLAIVAMAAYFGECDNLEKFQQLVLQGKSNFIPMPDKRWRGIDCEVELLKEYGLAEGHVPQGAYIDSFNMDFMYFKIPPRKTDALIPQQMLLLQVADEAVYQAQLKQGANVAVLVAMGIELEIHRYRGRVNVGSQIKSALAAQGIELSAVEQNDLIALCKAALHDEASINQYTSFIGNIMAARVSALWDFSGPAFTVSAEENSVFQCLDIAENLFKTSDVEAIVIAAVDLVGSAEHILLRNRLAKVSSNPQTDSGWFVGEGAGAIVVKPFERVMQTQEVIVRIDACSLQSGQSGVAMAETARSALRLAECTVDDIAYVEAHASGITDQDAIEAEMLAQVYPQLVHVGSVKNNVGHSFAASGMASLIKVACCLSARQIPQNPQTSSSITRDKKFTAQPWPEHKRAVINSMGADGRCAHLVVSPIGSIRHIPREAPKRQLVIPVCLGDETIQNKILSPEAVAKFAVLKGRNSERSVNGASYLTHKTEASTLNQPALGSFVELELLNESAVCAQRFDAPACAATVQNACQINKQLPALPMKINYNIPQKIVWNTADLIEFAEGNIANVFGQEFAIIDSYRRRVRLPTSDYLLVTRVTELQATPHQYEPCMMTTEYDIPLDAAYLMDGQIAWSVAVESGQCDLLLISYLGIDFKNKGERVYRLLDCTLTFLEDIAFGGDTLRYEIHIDSFSTQGDTTLFFFHYDCYVKDRKVLEMRNGCAGFFTDEELAAGKGVVRTAKEIQEYAKVRKQPYTPFLICHKTEFQRKDLVRLISGDLVGCFGSQYEQNGLNPSLQFSSEKFLMIDHICSIDPQGGAWGLGLVESYKILEPDHWYFPCHFKDDQVMAGSLMSDGCGQLVMFYMLYTGMHTLTKNARFQPLLGEKQTVRCRGQVTPQSNRLYYRMEVKEVGLGAIPYVKANVEIILDGKVVVDFQNMSVIIKEQDDTHPYARQVPEHAQHFIKTASADVQSSMSQNVNAPLMCIEPDLTAPTKHGVIPLKHFPAPFVEGQNRQAGQFPFTAFHFFEFATGSIAKCFGEEFAFYDNRIPPRTPCGDLQLVTRVLSMQGVRGEFKTPSSCIAEYEVPRDAWYFKKGAHLSIMPYSILMEIALQPNGFLSACMGTTLIVKDQDVFFRNLDGCGEILRYVDLRGKTITNHSVLLSTTVLGSSIIQSFSFELSAEGVPFYVGTAVFGYFAADALKNQLGLDKGEVTQPWHVLHARSAESLNLADANLALYQQRADKPHYRLAGGQLNFIDVVNIVEAGGKYAKGYIYAERTVNPADWFFQFHFHQDPVMPGSLGVEAIIEAMQAYMLKNDLGAQLNNPRFAQPLTKIVWKYRGQIIPLNRQMSLDIHIKDIVHEHGRVTLVGDANLHKDGLRIYQVMDIAVCLEQTP